MITALEPLRREDLVRILTEPKMPCEAVSEAAEYDMVKLVFTPGSLEAVADKSMERGIGARGLRAVLEEIMSPIMYDIPSDSAIVEWTSPLRASRTGAGYRPDSGPPPQPHLGGSGPSEPKPAVYSGPQTA